MQSAETAAVNATPAQRIGIETNHCDIFSLQSILRERKFTKVCFSCLESAGLLPFYTLTQPFRSEMPT